MNGESGIVHHSWAALDFGEYSHPCLTDFEAKLESLPKRMPLYSVGFAPVSLTRAMMDCILIVGQWQHLAQGFYLHERF